MTSGIYAWKQGDRVLYVGKSSNLQRRLRRYQRNLRNLAAAREYPYRRIHLGLAVIPDATWVVLELCPIELMSAREAHYIDTLAPELNNCRRAEAARRRALFRCVVTE